MKIPQNEKIILSQQDQLNILGYIAMGWAHYNTIIEGPIVHNNVQSECNIQNNPNRSRIRLEHYHSCANQRHPDIMHNIIPPHKGATILRCTKNGKRIPQNKTLKLWKSRPHTNQGIYYHSGCGPNAQPIGPSMRVQHTECDFHLSVGPQQALILQPHTHTWPHTPQSHHQIFFQFPLVWHER